MKKSILMIVSLILTGCLVQPTVPPNSISTNQLAPKSTVQSTQVPTRPPIKATPTDNHHSCTRLSRGSISHQGYLYLENQYKPIKDSLLDLSSNTFKDFSDNYSNLIVSPFRNSIAYLDLGLRKERFVLFVDDEQGTTQPLINQDIDIKYIEWVNDHTLAISDSYRSNTYVFLLNLSTGNITKVAINFPDLWNDPPLSNIWAKDIMQFDPMLQYVVYPKFGGVGLRELKDDALVQTIETSPYRYYPAWSPTGESFIIPLLFKKGEIGRVFPDGMIEVLTDFASKYSDFDIHSYGWSPDGDKIAFWIDIPSPNGNVVSHLAFLRLDDDEIVETCLESRYFTAPGSHIPIWSPDGTKLAVQVISKDKSSLIYLVDTTNLNFSILDKTNHSTPIGWLSYSIIP